MSERTAVDTSWAGSVILSDDRKRRIVKCLNIRENPLMNKAKNATCEITRLTVNVELGSGETTDLTFIAKKIPNEGMKTFLREFGIFEAEIRMYGIFNKMEKLMADHSDFREALWCQLKGYNETVIILEDLTASGYGPMHNIEMVDEERTIYVLRDLARYHAMGRALIEKSLVDLTKFTSLNDMTEKSQNMFHRVAMNALRTAVQNNWGPEWSDTVNQLNQMIDNLGKVVGRMSEMNETTMNVICHGDCWKGNVMLKTDPLGNILSLKFVDFQFSTYATYAYDLCVFLYTSVQHELRWTRLDQLLRAYHDSLIVNIEFYKLDPKTAPTLDGIKNDVERLRAVNIISMAIYWPIISSEVSNFEPNTDWQSDEIFKPEMYTSEKVRRILGRELKALLGQKLF